MLLPEKLSAAAASLGFDRIRLVAPVFIGDTVTTAFEIVSTEPDVWQVPGLRR